jgi:hypothetical protein
MIEELSVLQQMIGIWDEVVQYRPSEWMPSGDQATSTTTKRMVLAGHYILFSGVWQPKNSEFMNLVTYDSNALEYRSWYFDSAGAFSNSPMRGQWEPRTRVITWHSTDSTGNETIGTNTIIDDDHNEWTTVSKDPAGKVLLDAYGELKRRHACLKTVPY